MTPHVTTNSEGFMSGDEIMNAMSGASGTPVARSPPASGIAANVHMGENTPSTAAAKMGAPPFRVRNSRTFDLLMSSATITAANAPIARNTRAR